MNMETSRGGSRWESARAIAVYVFAGAALGVLLSSATCSLLGHHPASSSCSPPVHGWPSSPPSSPLSVVASRAVAQSLQEVASMMIGLVPLPVLGTFTFGGMLLLEAAASGRRATSRSLGRFLALFLSAGAGGWALSQVYSTVASWHRPSIAVTILIISGIGVLLLTPAADMPALSTVLRRIP